ncbi:MAG: AI-2E family transporter [Rhodospirillales bacterium]|nr:AI-2E family transporter [Rhodospirillales bacterium]
MTKKIAPARPLLQITAPFLGLLVFLAAVFLFFWLFQDMLLPFILGAIIAYLIDPIVERLDRVQNLKRPVAVLAILMSFLAILGGLLAILVPLMIREATQLVNDLPGMVDHIVGLSDPWISFFQDKLGLSSQKDLKTVMSNHWGEALKAGGMAGDLLKSVGQGILGFFTTVIFTVIISYFMLNEWPKMAKWMGSMIPRPYQDQTLLLAKDINQKLSGFIRGQLTVAFLLGVAYAIALALAGLNYGILIGFMSGVLGVIPMVGSVVGLIVSVGVAFIQEGSLSYVGLIAGIFLAGQVIEGNFLTPKIVGDSVGLHPLWVFFALLAGGTLMGIVGMLIAVPVAAIVSVLLRFAIEQYKQSVYYRGHD